MLNPDIDFERTDCHYPADRQGDVIEWIEVSVIVVAAVGFVVGFLLSIVIPPASDPTVRSPLATHGSSLIHGVASRDAEPSRRAVGEAMLAVRCSDGAAMSGSCPDAALSRRPAPAHLASAGTSVRPDELRVMTSELR